MSRLSLKTLKRKNLAYGKFKFRVDFVKPPHSRRYDESNAGDVEKIRKLLTVTGKGLFRFTWRTNSKGRRIYTRLHLTEAMDLTLIKLVHPGLLFKIYRIVVEPTFESLSASDRIAV